MNSDFQSLSVGVDSAGNVYIADSGNNRVRKVSNGVITTVAGNGNFGLIRTLAFIVPVVQPIKEWKSMRLLKHAILVLPAGLLIAALSSSVFAQAQDDKQADRQKNETTITGCLTKDASGGYTLADEKTGAKSAVTGAADLEKHSANHKVTLTGTTKSDASGKSVFEVTKIQHIAAECKAPSQ